MRLDKFLIEKRPTFFRGTSTHTQKDVIFASSDKRTAGIFGKVEPFNIPDSARILSAKDKGDLIALLYPNKKKTILDIIEIMSDPEQEITIDMVANEILTAIGESPIEGEFAANKKLDRIIASKLNRKGYSGAIYDGAEGFKELLYKEIEP